MVSTKEKTKDIDEFLIEMDSPGIVWNRNDYILWLEEKTIQERNRGFIKKDVEVENELVEMVISRSPERGV